MKHATSEKTRRQTKRVFQQDTTAGQNAISLAPPAYGIDFVDRDLMAAEPIQRSQGSLKGKSEALGAGNDKTDIAERSLQRSLDHKAQVFKRATGSSRPAVQAQLTLGRVGDKYEREADQVAKEVVGTLSFFNQQAKPQTDQQTARRQEELMMKPTDSLQCQPMEGGKEMLQAKTRSTAEGGAIPPHFQDAIQGARGGGQPLVDKVRTPVEQAFGADFSGVRVHTDAQSNTLNQSLQARAFTTGQDIFFRQGEYSPGNLTGQELLAHELTHVVQQTGNAANRHPNSTRPLPISQSNELTVNRYFEIDFASEVAAENYIEKKFKQWSKMLKLNRTSARRKKAAQLLSQAPPEYKEFIKHRYHMKFGELLDEPSEEIEKPVQRERELTLLNFFDELKGMEEEMKTGELSKEFEDTIDEVCQYLKIPNPLTSESKLDIEGNLVAPIEALMPVEKVLAIFKGHKMEGKKAIEGSTLAGALKGSFSTDFMNQIGMGGKTGGKVAGAKTGLSTESFLSFLAGEAIRNKSVTEIQLAMLAFLKGDLLTLFKLGAGANLRGNAGLALSGLQAQVLADAFLGMRLDISGTLEWGSDLLSQEVVGNLTALAGLSADLGMSASLGLTGLAAALEAGVFAGAKIDVAGSNTLKIGGRPVFSGAGTASFTAGAGAGILGNIRLGPAGFTMEFGAEATLGLGFGYTSATVVDLKNLVLGVKEIRSTLTNWHVTQVLGYKSMNIEMADRLKALTDVRWYVGQELGKYEKGRKKKKGYGQI